MAAARQRCRDLTMAHEKHRDDGDLREAKNMERDNKAAAQEERHRSSGKDVTSGVLA
jgi:hypothetical protein